MPMIAPSLLAADFSCLEREISRVSSAGMLHLDSMDGCFVPNISFGPPVISALRDKTSLFFDVHLMLLHPISYIESFQRSGADGITFHIECEDDPATVLHEIKSRSLAPGIAIKPATPPEAVAPYAQELKMVTVMTVEPGFGGQKLIPSALEKVTWLKKHFPQVLVQVDGGVNAETAPLCLSAGADILVAGTAVFRAPDPSAAMNALLSL